MELLDNNHRKKFMEGQFRKNTNGDQGGNHHEFKIRKDPTVYSSIPSC